MEKFVASKTALATSLMRAIHARKDPKPILNDPWGDRLIPPSMMEQIKQAVLSQSTEDVRLLADDTSDSIFDGLLRASSAYSGVITRSRYTEDALQSAVARGVRQYVIIGAGFDSYALRRPAEFDDLEIFEIDHPATQSLKMQCLAESGVSVPDSVHFLPADLAEEKIAKVLSRSSFKPTEPAFFSWLGVTMYLSREANMDALRGIAQTGAKGSELVFTYIDQKYFSTETSSHNTELDYAEIDKQVASMGEPMISGFDPDSLALDLECVYLKLEEDLDCAQVIDRYDQDGLNGLQRASRSRIARALVVDPPAVGGEVR